MPDSLKFLIIIGILGGAIYGGAWLLANFPLDPVEIEKTISSDKLRG